MDILIDFVGHFLQDRNEDDAFDRLNYQITPFLFVLLSLVNISKLYIGSAINCFTKAEFRGGWIQYAHDYCLIENTYYVRTDEAIPVEREVRGEKKIAYYQWVPFILVMQAASFYIPHLLWQSFNWITGYQVRALVTAAKEAATQPMDEDGSRGQVRKIANSLFHASQLRHRTLRIFRDQQFVSILYLAMKFSYLLLICFHLCVFKFFLGSLDFAIGFLHHRGEWEQTGHFPRVTVCDFTVYKYAQPMNFTVECVLPLNMFNEKIFVFFFFWLCLLLALTIFSICLWMCRIQNRKWYFRKLLDIQKRNDPTMDESRKPLLANFDGENSISIKNDASRDLVFGSDLRVIFGLIQDQAGVIFCANVFREICNFKEEAHSKSSPTPPPPPRLH